MRLFIQYLKMQLNNELAYRTSFILLTIGQFFVPFSVFIGFAMLFQRFGNIKGYSFSEMALCYGVIQCAFAIAECLVRGFDTFSNLIREGGFDRLLLRPRGLVIQVLGSKFEFSKIGKLLQSLIAIGIGLAGLNVPWPLWKSFLLTAMILSGAAIFSGIFILFSTMCFWTVEGMELANVLTDGGRELAQFPLNIYRDGFRRFFTFVIPFGMANYYPLLVLMDRTEAHWYNILAPLYGIIFLLPCVLIWYQGVKKYQSCGS